MRVALRAGLAAALVGGAAAAHAAEPLRLCADPTNLPFSSNAPGHPGMYVEIAQAVAKELGRELRTVWSLSYFGKRNLRTTLLAGQCDFAVGLPAEGDFMGPRVIFSRPILQLGYALVVPKGQSQVAFADLAGKRVAVQFATPPQSVLAARGDITSVTVMSPEEGMQRLAAGEADAAFVWGPNAGYVNHTVLHDAYRLIPVDAPQMKWPAAIGFASKDKPLRDEVDAVLGRLEPRIRDIAVSYAATAGGPAITLNRANRLQATTAWAGPVRVTGTLQRVAADGHEARAAQGKPAQGNAAAGHQTFNGTCAHCHGPDAVVADRKINLRRLKAKYGDDMTEVFFTTATNGRPTKGMPAWKDVFKPEDLANILAYLETVQEE